MSDPKSHPSAASSDIGATEDYSMTANPSHDTPNADYNTLPPPAEGDATSLIGETIGDFEIQEEIGRGGMGVVYKAHQVSLDRPVAIKMLLTSHVQNATLRSRFLTEARSLASLSHPNIINVFQVGDCHAGDYFVMEYIDGPSLDALLKQRPISVAGAVGLLLAVTDAVGHAHSKGIVHRDLKPANIMLTKSWRPVVMDFGIAKVLGGQSKLTQEGVLIGTPAYMSPEQADEQSGEIGPATDIYALGAILYTLLAGQPPFNEGTALRTILKVISPDMPPPPKSIHPEIPADLDRLCLKCMSKKPHDR